MTLKPFQLQQGFYQIQFFFRCRISHLTILNICVQTQPGIILKYWHILWNNAIIRDNLKMYKKKYWKFGSKIEMLIKINQK